MKYLNMVDHSTFGGLINESDFYIARGLNQETSRIAYRIASDMAFDARCRRETDFNRNNPRDNEVRDAE